MTQKQKNNASNQVQHAPTQQILQDQQKEGASWLSVMVSIFTVLTTILLALGYGYQRGVAELFHLEVSDIADSVSDFLIAAPDALALVFTKMVEKFSIFNLWEHAIFPSIGLALLLLIILYLARKESSQKDRVKDEPLREESWIKKAWFQYPLAFIGGIGIIPLTTIIIYAVIVIALAAPFMIVLPFGYYPGKYNAENTIVNPQHCAPLPKINIDFKKPHTEPNKPNKEVFVNCVAVLKDGKEIARGRRIAIHAERIFLYIAKTGEVKGVPLNDATVVLVDSEEPPNKNDVNVKLQDSAKTKIEKQVDVK